MPPEIFARGLKKFVVDANIETYRDLFETTDVKDATDPYFRSTLEFWNRLAPDDRDVLASIIRQTIIDSVSTVLAILDGHVELDSSDVEEIRVSSGTDELAGELQDAFLELCEEDDEL